MERRNPGSYAGLRPLQTANVHSGPGGSVVPPNNWKSYFGGSAWEWVPARRQFYYHKFYKKQPDLNWRNPAVEAAMFGAMGFWLDSLASLIHELTSVLPVDEPSGAYSKLFKALYYNHLENAQHDRGKGRRMARDESIDLLSTSTLLEGWSKVIRVDYVLKRQDGTFQRQDRDLLDRGDGITVLLYNTAKATILLVRQARVVAKLRNLSPYETIEACNGLVETESPLQSAFHEVAQELGHRPKRLESVAEVIAAPGASLEIVHIFLGEYDADTQISSGGGVKDEGEDIEVLEVPLRVAVDWIAKKVIVDARTVIALQILAIREGMYASAGEPLAPASAL